MDILEQRYRLNYSKRSFIRFTSILDLQEIWVRAFRRAGIKLAYSKGFHPQPKMQQASPLPLGFCGEDEILDIWVEQTQDQRLQSEQVNPYVPAGLEIHQITLIDLASPSLQQFVDFSDYSISGSDSLIKTDLTLLFEKVSDMDHILITKHNGKQYDLKPLIKSIFLDEETTSQNPSLLVSLSSAPGATGRPDHLLQYFHLNPSRFIITRKKIHFTDHG